MTLFEIWLKKNNYWKEEYKIYTYEQLKELTHEVQYMHNREEKDIQYMVDKAKYILTHK